MRWISQGHQLEDSILENSGIIVATDLEDFLQYKSKYIVGISDENWQLPRLEAAIILSPSKLYQACFSRSSKDRL